MVLFSSKLTPFRARFGSKSQVDQIHLILTQFRQKIRSLATPAAPFLHPFDSVEAPCGSCFGPKLAPFRARFGSKNQVDQIHLNFDTILTESSLPCDPGGSLFAPF